MVGRMWKGYIKKMYFNSCWVSLSVLIVWRWPSAFHNLLNIPLSSRAVDNIKWSYICFYGFLSYGQGTECPIDQCCKVVSTCQIISAGRVSFVPITINWGVSSTFLFSSSLLSGMAEDSSLAWRVGEGGKKYTCGGQNQPNIEEIVPHFQIHSAAKLLLLGESQQLYPGHQLLSL